MLVFLNKSHVSLLGEFDFVELCSLGHHVLVLNTHNISSPGSSLVFVFVEFSAEVLGKEFKILVVFLFHFSNGDAGSGLAVNKLSESSLSLNETVRDALLSAESRKVDHQFDWVNIMSHHDKLGFALFNELGHMVQTELDNNGFWCCFLSISTCGFCFSFLLKSDLLFFLSLWLVFCK